MLKILLAIAVGTTAAAAAKTPGPVHSLGPHLAQVRSFAAGEGDRVWAGYSGAPFGFLLITDSEEILLCRDQVPTGFAEAGSEPATGCKHFTRPRSGFPSNLLAAMPLFGPPSVIVMGTPRGTGKTEAAWVRTILHEHFHQWQYALPNYFDRIQALDLHGGDQSGMWALNYAFPYEDPAVGVIFDKASLALAEAVDARGTPGFGASLDKYLRARSALAAHVGDRNWRYLEFQLWQEGVARWTEIRLGKWYPRQDVRDSAAGLEQATVAALRTQKLSERKREVVYAHGAAEAMLLQACGLDWRGRYPQVLALGPLLEQARAACAGRAVSR